MSKGMRYDETSAGELSRGFDELRPGEFAGAVLLERELHPAHCARNTRGAIADERSTFAFDEVAALVEIHVAMRSAGRHLAVINRGRSTVPQTDHHEAAAAEIARGRMRDG